MEKTTLIHHGATAAFRRLHDSGCFVLPNPWDIGTARYLARLGFKALATTSAGFAFSRGAPDGGVSRDEMLEHIRETVAATSLPVNADYQTGFAEKVDAVNENVALCVAAGVAGLSLEDATGRGDKPLFTKKEAVERIKAGRAAIDASGVPVVLTGRCEAFLVGHSDALAVALDHLVAYAEAGADCLYAPGLATPDEISAVVKAVAPKAVNVLVSGFNSQLTLAQLTELGVRRISVGSGLASVAWGAFIRAATEISKDGSFANLSSGASHAHLNESFAKS